MSTWFCPICGYEIEGGDASYYAQGNDARIEILEGEVEKLDHAIRHLVLEHLMTVVSKQSEVKT